MYVFELRSSTHLENYERPKLSVTTPSAIPWFALFLVVVAVVIPERLRTLTTIVLGPKNNTYVATCM